MTFSLLTLTVGEIVALDARAAGIFERFHIDFCCNGHKTLAEAFAGNAQADIAEELLQRLLDTPASPAADDEDYRSWSPDRLADHIETKFHRETTRQITAIQGYLETLCRVHGVAHPELFFVKRLFDESAGELAMHMKKEELVLFPYIRKIVRTGQKPAAVFGSVEDPIRVLTHDHEEEGERFRKIAELTANYTIPPDGCQTYRLAYQSLAAFETMLHFHIHLENNILFPRVLALG